MMVAPTAPNPSRDLIIARCMVSAPTECRGTCTDHCAVAAIVSPAADDLLLGHWKPPATVQPEVRQTLEHKAEQLVENATKLAQSPTLRESAALAIPSP